MPFLVRALAVIAVVVLMTLMLGPFERAGEVTGIRDEVAHFIAFLVIASALLVVFPTRPMWALGAGAVMLGVAVELIQGATGRSASASDLVADMVGILVAMILWRRPQI